MTAAPLEIFLAEDGPADLELTLDALRQEGLGNHVEVARDGAEALDLLFAPAGRDGGAKRRPRLILLDLKLPKVDGLEVLRAIKSSPATKQIPVVILSSSRQRKDLEAAYALGVNSYIVKPVEFAEFSAAVRSLGRYWLQLNEAPGEGA